MTTEEIKSRLQRIVCKINSNATSLWNPDLEDSTQCIILEECNGVDYNGWAEDIEKLILEL